MEEKKVVTPNQTQPKPAPAPAAKSVAPQQAPIKQAVQSQPAKPAPQAQVAAHSKPVQPATPQKVQQPQAKPVVELKKEEAKEAPQGEFKEKPLKAKLYINIAGLALYLGALLGFLFPFVMVRIYNVRTQQFDGTDYYGWQLALNFDGTLKNLGTLIPLVSCLAAFILGVILLINKIKRLKKKTPPKYGSMWKIMLYGFLFIGFAGLVTLFLALSSVNIAAPHVNKPYQGHFLGLGAYFTAYCALLGGLAMFIAESGIIKE